MTHITRTLIILCTILTIALVCVLPRRSQASCAAPLLQVSPDLGQTVSPSCAILVAVPEMDGPFDPTTLKLAWSGGVIPVAVSAPARQSIQQWEAFIDPKTCQEYAETWDVSFLVYTLTPQQTLPLDVQIQIVADQSVLGDFMVGAAATYCPGLTLSVGMCGSGGAAPVDGCDWPPTGLVRPPGTGGEPQVQAAGEGGCSVAPVSGGAPAAPPLALLLVALVICARCLRRR